MAFDVGSCETNKTTGGDVNSSVGRLSLKFKLLDLYMCKTSCLETVGFKYDYRSECDRSWPGRFQLK